MLCDERCLFWVEPVLPRYLLPTGRHRNPHAAAPPPSFSLRTLSMFCLLVWRRFKNSLVRDALRQNTSLPYTHHVTRTAYLRATRAHRAGTTRQAGARRAAAACLHTYLHTHLSHTCLFTHPLPFYCTHCTTAPLLPLSPFTFSPPSFCLTLDFSGRHSRLQLPTFLCKTLALTACLAPFHLSSCPPFYFVPTIYTLAEGSL